MKRIRHFSMSIALLLVLVITLGIGTAYAWFTDTKSGSGSIQFGKIEIDVTSNGSALSNNTFNKTNLLPGDSILDYDVIANKTADSQPFYFRVELSFSVDSSISSYADTLNSLLTAENIGNGSNFVKDTSVTDRAVFYYGTADALTEVTNENPIVILDKDKFTIPTTLTQLLDYAQYNEKASLSITVIALQSVNMTATIAGFKSVNFSSNTSSSGTYEISEDGKYMLFGSYPQTLKADSVTVSATAGSDGYYTGSDGEKYAKHWVNNYATQLGGSSSDWRDTWEMSTAGDGTKMTLGLESYYYFKVEPIKWRILSTADGAYTLVCDNILSGLAYQPWYSGNYATDGTNILTDNGSQVYANNYKWSNLYDWLNTALRDYDKPFYEMAFSSSERSQILTASVDNSVNQYPSDLGVDADNQYLCENTTDKVYALSIADVCNTDYGFNNSYLTQDIARYWATTDYAKATGAATITEGYLTSLGVAEGSDEWNMFSPYIGSGYVWLRSPTPSDSHKAYAVAMGLIAPDGCIITGAYLGAVPAIRISI